jgi:hypothetical protein
VKSGEMDWGFGGKSEGLGFLRVVERILVES